MECSATRGNLYRGAFFKHQIRTGSFQGKPYLFKQLRLQSIIPSNRTTENGANPTPETQES